MPKGYKNSADWDGLAMAAADAMFEQERGRVRRDHPRPIPTEDRLAEIEARHAHPDTWDREWAWDDIAWLVARCHELLDLRAQIQKGVC